MSQAGGDWSSADLVPLLLLFISSAFSDKVPYSGISKKGAAVGFCAKLRGLEDFKKSYWFSRCLKGIDGDHGVLIRVVQCPSSCPSECSSPYELVLFWAAFSLAFFRAFRISEFVSQSRSAVSGLLRADVQVSDVKGQLVCCAVPRLTCYESAGVSFCSVCRDWICVRLSAWRSYCWSGPHRRWF